MLADRVDCTLRCLGMVNLGSGPRGPEKEFARCERGWDERNSQFRIQGGRLGRKEVNREGGSFTEGRWGSQVAINGTVRTFMGAGTSTRLV